MRGGSSSHDRDSPDPTKATAWKGLQDNSIYNVWNHGYKLEGQGIKCQYCILSNKGGGATRLRDHLAWITGEVRSCPTVPKYVREAMMESRADSKKKKKEKENRKLRLEREIMEGLYRSEGVINIPDDEEEQVQMTLRESLKDKNVNRAAERRCGSGGGVRVSLGKRSISIYFDKELANNKIPMQPRIDTALMEGSREIIGKARAKFFHANDIAGLKADCPYFRATVKITQQLGATPVPTSREIDGVYLEANYDEAEGYVKKFKQDWNNYGVTVMCDPWTRPTGMSIINFMVYCNARMFFHKSVDASGHMQNSEFIYREIKKAVVEEIGLENVVQIITDNGSNYKKACKTLVEEPEYNHIVWQPCAAHTINLMLKDIAKFREVGVIVKSAKQICRFFYNHNALHDNMKKKIGGELIKPNATRFGTVYMFLESFHLRKEKFRQWMMSNDWKESIWKNDPDYVFAEECLSSNMWWTALEWVLEALEPLYLALKYADTQKYCTLSGFKKVMMAVIHSMEGHLGNSSRMFYKFMSKVSKRINAMEKDTLMVAAAVLDPYTHYKYNFSNMPDYALALTDAMEKIATPESAVLAVNEIRTYRECLGRFGHSLARSSAETMSPTEWWFQFGGEVPTLQKYALRIVSQCVSSSGCERNWSTFALVHTKVRNRLGYNKLHKLVYVHYNLKVRVEEDAVKEKDRQEKEVDPCLVIMDTTMFAETNPIMEWLNEDVDEPILDGADAASNVFEEIRRLNSSRKASQPGRKDNGRKRYRVEEEDDDFIDSEDDEQENDYIEIDDDDDDHDNHDSGGETEPTNNGSSENLSSRWASHARKTKDVTSLYK